MNHKTNEPARTVRRNRKLLLCLVALLTLAPVFLAFGGVAKATSYALVMFIFGLILGKFLEQIGLLIGVFLALLVGLWLVPHSDLFQKYSPIETWLDPAVDQSFWLWSGWLVSSAAVGGLLGMILFWEGIRKSNDDNYW